MGRSRGIALAVALLILLGAPRARRPEPLLVLRVVETWKDQERQAEALLSLALKISPTILLCWKRATSGPPKAR